MRRKRIHVGRRVGRIGFLGKGMSVPSRVRSDVAHALALRVGDEKISTDDADCEHYRYDFTPYRSMLRGIFSRRPEVVVFPDSGQCVADILDICIEEKTPAVPRGGGSAGLGGAIPVRGGVVIDLSRLDRVISIDRSAKTVMVEAGCSWKKLEGELKREELCLRSYPASGGSGTVGGWMSTGGLGVGTHREGAFHGQVLSMEVALASGLLVTSTAGEGRYAIRSFAGTEGQVGIVTKLTLPVKEKPDQRACYLLRLKREIDGFEALRQLARVEDPPFSARLIGQARARLFCSKTGLQGGEAGLVSIVEEGDAARMKRCDKMVRQIASAAGLDVDDGPDAWKAWEETALYSNTVTEGRVRLAGEVLVGAERAGEFAVALGGALPSSLSMGYECQLVDDGRALFRVGVIDDQAGSPGPTRDVLATGRVTAVGLKAGGTPYGIGLWNSAYSKRAVGPAFRDLKMVKREIDRLGLLNPGKFFSFTTKSGLPVPAWAYRFAVAVAGRS